MKRWLAAGLALALAAGCARRETQVSAGDRDQILYRGNASEPESLDPYLVRGAVEWTIVGGLFEGLVTADVATLEPRPGVAERWEISADGLVYTFHLRANAAWSDGTPVTAGDFDYGARRLLAPRLGAAHAENNLFFVRGASDYQAGRIKDFAAVGVKARDPRTLEITLARPTPFFLSALILFFPVPQATVEKFAAMDERVNNWIRPGNLVGNGAFRLKAWRQNQGVVLERNPRYWDAARVRLKEIHFLPIENAQAEEAAFRTGQLHLTSAVPLNKFLGITVKLRNEETQVLNSSKRQMDFQLVRGSWNATTYQDPFYFLGAWRSGALYNESKWSNAEFDRLIEATWTVDRAVREKAFQDAEEIFLRELPAIPLFFSTQTMLMSPSVKGWQPKPFADRRLKDLWLEK